MSMKIADFAARAVGLFLALLIVPPIAIVGLFPIFVPYSTYKIGNKCEIEWTRSQKNTSENVITDSFWQRTLQDHYISAKVIQPLDMNQSEKTVVCHFKGRTAHFDRLEVIDGNKLELLKKLSRWTYVDPRTWSLD